MFSPRIQFRTPRSDRREPPSRRTRLEVLEERRVLDGAGLPMLVAADGENAAVPDFDLVDTNATSPTYDQTVSPRDYLAQVSAWYFGEAT